MKPRESDGEYTIKHFGEGKISICQVLRVPSTLVNILVTFCQGPFGDTHERK